MLFSDLFEKLLFFVSVPKCVRCQELLEYGETVFCKSCLMDYNNQKLRSCSRCSHKIGLCTCSNAYLESHFVRQLIKVYRYNSKDTQLAGNRVIYALKTDYRRDVFAFLAREIAGTILESLDIRGHESDYIITNVPRRSASIQKYGYDHCWEIVKRVGKILGIKPMKLLTSRAKKAQKETHGQDRMKNPDLRYARFNESLVKGKRLLLFDDVVTTGASMGISAAMLRGIGIKNITGVALSIAFKDSYARPINKKR